MLKHLSALLPLSILEKIEYLILQNFPLLLFVATKTDPEFFEYISQRKAIREFKRAARYVPAYKDFLNKNKINPKLIRNILKFNNLVPEMTKDSYIKKYPIEKICIDGVLPIKGNIDESAGSSGKPTNWVRSVSEERLLSKMVGFEFEYDYGALEKDYIVLSAWASGPWATGVKFCELIQDYSLVKNTDANIENVIKTIKKFGTKHPYLIAGYPPFLKQMVDTKGIKWKNYKIDIITGGEGFIPEWRIYMKNKLKDKSKILSAYGCSDVDVGIAVETAFSISIRRLLVENKALRDHLCDGKIPMVFQYDSLQHYIRQVNNKGKIGEIEITLLNPDTACPKIKYNIKDEGCVIRYNDMISSISQFAPDLLKKFKQKKGTSSKILKFPFLMIVGRRDGTLSFDGGNVYPHNIEVALNKNKKILDVTSEFKMEKVIDKKENVSFVIYIELRKNTKPNKKLNDLFSKVILNTLLEINEDYKRSYINNKSLKPKIKLMEYEQGVFKNKDTIKNKYII